MVDKKVIVTVKELDEVKYEIVDKVCETLADILMDKDLPTVRTAIHNTLADQFNMLDYENDLGLEHI